MNEMLEQLKIDPEFEKVIPPLTKDEYHQLEENILDDGRIMMPIAVWGDIIVDGHNRYRIAREYGDIPFSTTQLTFANRHEVIAWICKNQLGRRNLSDEQKHICSANAIPQRNKLKNNAMKMAGLPRVDKMTARRKSSKQVSA